MNWLFQKKTPQSGVIEFRSSNTKESEPKKLFLLLINPSLLEIFAAPPDNTLVDADVAMTSSGMFNVQGKNLYLFRRLPVLCIGNDYQVGYTIPMILDLQIWLHKMAEGINPPINYPEGLFINRDALIVTDGIYTVRLFHNDVSKALKAQRNGNDEFPASHIIYSGTTTDEENISNLRKLEADVTKLLTPTPSSPPKLPPELGWEQFLEPIFNHVKEVMQNKKIVTD